MITGAVLAAGVGIQDSAVASPQGELVWAIHTSLAPTWFGLAETLGIITPFLVLYALHDAMVKP
jgi:peptide/nickel transport system substrate-binding protein